MADSHCRYCDRDIETGEPVRLWDGRDYCEECVETALPGLAEYARTHPALSDTPQRETLPALMILTLLGGGLLSLIIVLAGHHVTWPLTLGIGFGFALAAWVVFWVLGLISGFRHIYPTVTIENGEVVADYWHDERRERSGWAWGERRYKLADCDHWFELTALCISADTLRGRKRFRRQLVALKVPWRSVHYHCGWSPEMRERWKAFFTLAGIPKRGS